MKLYIKTELNGREYLPNEARTRPELAQKLGSTFINVEGRSYRVNDVKAVAVHLVMSSSLILGGMAAVGVLLGTLFATHTPALCFLLSFGGVLAGLYVASMLQKKEDRRAMIFNSSRIHFESTVSDSRLAQAA